MSEKRIFNRRQLIYYFKIIDIATGTEFGNLVDLTSEGLMVMRETALKPNTKHKVRILLKKDPGQGDHIDIAVLCKWCMKQSYGNFYDAGFEMLDADAATIKRIEDVIEQLCF